MLVRFALFLLMLPVSAVAAVTYGVQAIAPPGALLMSSAGQNSSGVLVGSSAIVYNGGVSPDGSFIPLGFTPTGLTDSGQVTGQFLVQVTLGSQGVSYEQGYYYNGSSWLGIQNPFANDAATTVGMASNGALVGSVVTPSGNTHAIVWNTNGSWIDLNSLAGGYSNISAAAMNASGQVTGSADGRAFISNGSTITTINDPGAASSTGNAISADSRVAGTRTLSTGAQRAFVTDSLGVVTDLGTLGGLNSAALGVNTLGRVVGWSLDSSGNQRAFLYSNGVLSDLNSLLTVSGEWLITSAISINQSGIILATAVNGLGQYQTVLLTPEVPEPSTVFLTSTAIAWLIYRRNQRKSEQ